MTRLYTALPLAAALLRSAYRLRKRRDDHGERVEIRQQMNQDNCENLGPVFGKGGGSFGGSFISDEKSEYATNDLRNKAAAKGANVVVIPRTRWLAQPTNRARRRRQ